jgi:YfiH family protein
MHELPLPAPFQVCDGHIAIELPGARALFTTRHGGCSRGPFRSLNLGLATADDPERVAANRSKLQQRLGVALALGRQVHGTTVAIRGAPERPSGGREPVADGQATSHRGLAPAVLTADCLPVAIAGEGAVAVVHAGWRGLAGGVIAEGVRAVRELGARGALAAAIGPGAGGCCYEVGEEVLALFADYPQARCDGRRLHLAAVAAAQLRRAGVAEIHDIGLCTICTAGEPFFSHRRDGGITGRQAGLAWLR